MTFNDPMTWIEAFLYCCTQAIEGLCGDSIDSIVEQLVALRNRGGRLFILGNGGGAAHASHAAADFRTLAGIEAYAFESLPNVTALTNDDGWANTAAAWLRASNLKTSDALMVVSVGGGDQARNVSPNIVNAIDYARSIATPLLAVVGRDGGYAGRWATACVIVPSIDATLATPITEGLQSVILHLLVSHPKLAQAKPKWETADESRGVSRP